MLRTLKKTEIKKTKKKIKKIKKAGFPANTPRITIGL